MAAIVGHRRILIAAAAVLGIAAALAWAAAPGSARPAAHPGTYGYLSRHAVAALAATSWQGGAVQATNGETVTVYVSTSYGTSVGALQWADFFTGLIHGTEISAISIYVATPAEVVAECGRADVLGCYGNDRLLIPGETSDGVAPEEIARHEYGHHVAQHRLNPPWRGLDSGPKQWASYEGVCARVGAGTAFPGDEGEHYRQNPGEAWAESYRLLNDARAGIPPTWQIIDSAFYPDAGALQAIEADVLRPWTGPTVKTYRSRFTAKGKKVWTLALAAPLDGAVDVHVSLKPGELDDVTLLDSKGTVLGTALWAGKTVKTLQFQVCGQRSLVLRVTRRGAPGPFALTISQP